MKIKILMASITLLTIVGCDENISSNKVESLPKKTVDNKGTGYATDKVAKVPSKALDVQQDSFEVLRYLATQYINKHNNQLKLGQEFGVSYSDYVEDSRKSGFVGYEATTSSGKTVLIKIQLIKDINGWRVINQLANNQIRAASPVLKNIKGKKSRVERYKAELIAAKELEIFLNEKKDISLIRISKVNCYLTKNLDKASCRAIYGMKENIKVVCHDKNYLLTNDGGKWIFDSEILATQRVDYRTGELITKKPFSITCHY